MNFEIPKDLTDKMVVGKQYEVRGFYDGRKWQWNVIQID
jgi:hypothetical protein